MHYYHENHSARYYDASDADGAGEDLRPLDRSSDDRTFEPIRASVVLTWLVIASAGPCAIVAAAS